MDAESRTHQAQRIFGTQLRAHQMGRHDGLRIQAVEQATHNRGLARPHLPRDHDKTFTTHDAVFQISTRALVLLAAEIEARIGGQLEGFAV